MLGFDDGCSQNLGGGMVNEYLDGHAHGMRDVGANFSPPPVNFMPSITRSTSACNGGGMAECGKLTEANQAAIESIQTMVTHIMQGFEAYRSMILSSADCYADGDGMSANEFRNIIDHQDQNLPDKAQVFLEPAPTNGT
ncbi:hypothetical protein GCM10027290_55170 [Micromonospora sonneratiae]